MYIYVYTSLVKSHENIYGIAYRIKIMLSGIAIIKIEKNVNDDYLKLN